ncbi:stage V sporulation protein AF [Peribacillus deserti]|uniref:Stage V sporulation protein AF n=1 Tax=Peribacillus deserti TaxID=673318 RepID=A0ABS2QF04_9BACI|nr:spore germination protein [Peribacillus deserti]MBM7691726.1 stage V sporulation protein AF [Peribacillus deserti]
MEQVVKVNVNTSIDDNISYLNNELGIGKSFDIIHLDVEYGERKMAFYFVDGFVKDDILLHIMRTLGSLKKEQIEADTLKKLVKTYIPYVEVETADDLNKVVDTVLSGPTALVVDGLDKVIIIDARTYPVRGPEEPDTERVVRGARDGYVETIVFNTALTRRRIRDRTLRMEYMQVGRRSKTDVVVSYIEDIADPDLVSEIKKSLSEIDTDGVPMAEKSIEEFVAGRYWNPYPLVRFTERPDTAAAHLFEGHVCIIVDGSPSVIITPTTFWHHLHHAEEYRNKPLVGAYLRWVRFIAVWASIFLLPLWYLVSIDPSLLPEHLSYIGPNDRGEVPLFLQILFVEIGIDMLRMASIHTPSSLATALGLIAALLIGQIAVEVGLLTNEVILYLAVVSIGTFATPSYEMSLANRLIRIALLILTAAFHSFGYVIGVVLFVIMLARLQSFGVPYLWPLIPFNYKAFRDVLFRSPIPLKRRRPRPLNPKDPDR